MLTRLVPSWCLAVLLLAVAGLSGCTSPEQRAQNYYDHGKQLLAAGELDKAALEFATR